MTKVVKEFLLDNATGDVDIEYSDSSTLSYNLANAVTATQSAQGVRFVAPSGTVAVDGTITLGTALPATFSGGLWLYLPAGAIVSGAAAWYWADMSSTTVGVVRGSQGGAALVGSASAYTGVTAEATAYTCNIATPDVARSTILRLPTLCASGTNAKTIRLRVGGTAVLTTAISTTGQLGHGHHRQRLQRQSI